MSCDSRTQVFLFISAIVGGMVPSGTIHARIPPGESNGGSMADEASTGPIRDEREVIAAREQFHQALLVSHKTRNSIGDLEAAAAHFCHALRLQGISPERMLIDAKQVIEGAIDGDNRPLAEKAVLSCIQHYYRE